MSKSNAIRSADVRKLLRIMNETRDIESGFAPRVDHMLASLSLFFGARVGLLLMGKFDSSGDQWTGIVPMQHGMTDPVEIETVMRFARGELPPDPMEPASLGQFGTGRDFAIGFSDQHMHPDEWHRTAHFNEVRRPMRIDKLLYSIYRPPGALVSYGIGLNRAIGDTTPFTTRDTGLLNAFAQELTWLWRSAPDFFPESPKGFENRSGADADASRVAVTLPPRLAQVMRLLLAGLSEKQIARRLGIANATAHVHITRLYRALQVNSRAELMARFIPHD